MASSPVPMLMANSLSSRPTDANRLTGGSIMTARWILSLPSAGIDGFHDGRIGAAQTVSENVDIGDPDLSRQMRDDLLHGCVQIVAVLHQVARDPGARCRDDEAREGRRRHGQHVIAGAIQCTAQDGQLRRISVAARAR